MAKFFIRAEQIDEHGHKVDNCYSVLFGEHQVEHDVLSKAIAVCLELRTTGDWPDGRPDYWIEDEAGNIVSNDINWKELEDTMALAKELLSMR